MLLQAASEARGWNLHMATIAALWRAGCIIRAALLDPIIAAFRHDPGLANLMLDPAWRRIWPTVKDGWRRTVSSAVVGRRSGPRLFERPGLLRRLSLRATGGQPDPGPA